MSASRQQKLSPPSQRSPDTTPRPSVDTIHTPSHPETKEVGSFSPSSVFPNHNHEGSQSPSPGQSSSATPRDEPSVTPPKSGRVKWSARPDPKPHHPPARKGILRNSPSHSRQASSHAIPSITTSPPDEPSPKESPDIMEKVNQALNKSQPIKPLPAVRRGSSYGSVTSTPRTTPGGSPAESDNEDEPSRPRHHLNLPGDSSYGIESQRRANESAQHLATTLNHDSAEDGLEMRPLSKAKTAPMPHDDVTDSEYSDMEILQKVTTRKEADHLVRTHTQKKRSFSARRDNIRSGANTPVHEQEAGYIPQPTHWGRGIASSLLFLLGRGHQGSGGNSSRTSAEATPTQSPLISPPASGATTPRGKWYNNAHPNKSSSFTSLGRLLGRHHDEAHSTLEDLGEAVARRMKEKERQERKAGRHERKHSGSGTLSPWQGAVRRVKKSIRPDEHAIKMHIGDMITRQQYLLKLCKCLMEYGAPTHRLEETMKMSARFLEVESQFLYLPGCMIISFDDSEIHTTEVKLVRVAQGVDLGKLRDAHEVYKDVLHGYLTVQDAIVRLENIMKLGKKFRPLWLIPVFGIASASVGPFAFGARWIDLPIAWALGCIVGFMQLKAAPSSDLFSNVFEISATVVTSFLARLAGSWPRGRLFCFSALAQSSIALILPGYMVLCGALELQSRSIIAGSVRMVYAIIYSLFLGLGITIGTAIYGAMDHNATSATTCATTMPTWVNFPCVAIFTLSLCIINQAKWKQMPIMIAIAMLGYVVNYFSSQYFKGNAQVSNTLGALAIGILANGYSRTSEFWQELYDTRLHPQLMRLLNRALRLSRRLRRRYETWEGKRASNDRKHSQRRPEKSNRKTKVEYGLAAAAMLPAIFVQVPSGLAVGGSLVSGITSADQITGNATGSTVPTNGAMGDVTNTVVFNVAFSVIQVAIGITVGLSLGALILYPIPKRRSGLFSF